MGIECMVCVYALFKLSEAPLTRMLKTQQLSMFQATLMYRSVWALSCTLSCIAFLTTFNSIIRQSNRWWKSLAANAYGIYLTHYIFVLWCQYYLLPYTLHPVVKFSITTVVGISLGWLLTWILRKNAVIRKYL